MAKSLVSILLLLVTPAIVVANDSCELEDVNVLLQSGATVAKANSTDRQYPPVKPGYSSGATALLSTPGQRHRINTPRKGKTCGFAQGVIGTPHLFSREMPKLKQYLSCDQTTLPAGIPDMRGDWHWDSNLPHLLEVVSGSGQHNEHIEQCGDRILIVTDNAVLDIVHADGTFERGLQDYDEEKMPKCFERVAAGNLDAAGCLLLTDDTGFNGPHPDLATNPQVTKHKWEKRCLDGDGRLVYKNRKGKEIKMHRWNYPHPVFQDQAAPVRLLRQSQKAVQDTFDNTLKAHSMAHYPHAHRVQRTEDKGVATFGTRHSEEVPAGYVHDEETMPSNTVRPHWADYPTDSPLMAYQKAKSNMDEYYFNNPMAKMSQLAAATAADAFKETKDTVNAMAGKFTPDNWKADARSNDQVKSRFAR